MFELSIACKYLLPRWRQLSVSVISLISVGVIALVVWLIVVFFSVTNGLEKFWIDKLINLTGPIRVTPTEEYYRSYYNQVDSFSEASNYRTLSLAEKLARDVSDPYDPDYDVELPPHLASADRYENGELKDLTKELARAVESIPGTTISPYETTFGTLHLGLVRKRSPQHTLDGAEHSFLNQAAMFGSLEDSNPRLRDSIEPLRSEDFTNLLALAHTTAQDANSNATVSPHSSDITTAKERLHQVLDHIELKELRVAPEGWMIPRHLWQTSGWIEAAAVMQGDRPVKLIVANTKAETQALMDAHRDAGHSLTWMRARVGKDPMIVQAEGNVEVPLTYPLPIFLAPGQHLPAQLTPQSLEEANDYGDLRFQVDSEVQGIQLQGEVGLSHLQLANVHVEDTFKQVPNQTPLWVYYLQDGTTQAVLPSDIGMGEGVLLPRQFQEAGALVGDRGYISYYTPTATNVQEQQLPVYVAAFYDPGMIPIGGKLVFADSKLVSLIRSAHGSAPDQGAGIRVRFDDYKQADVIKQQLLEKLRQRDIAQYWKVETFREFEYAGDILRQQQSDKNLFMVIAVVIIIVACSNIISMLIILVNDKKLEIGILRSMGASSRSIAMIFGSCGFVMGLVGSIIGCTVALFTLHNLDGLIGMISWMQGHELFNPTFYGASLPSELSWEAIGFVLSITALFSLLAGIIPALKASWLQPSAILRSE